MMVHQWKCFLVVNKKVRSVFNRSNERSSVGYCKNMDSHVPMYEIICPVKLHGYKFRKTEIKGLIYKERLLSVNGMVQNSPFPQRITVFPHAIDLRKLKTSTDISNMGTKFGPAQKKNENINRYVKNPGPTQIMDPYRSKHESMLPACQLSLFSIESICRKVGPMYPKICEKLLPKIKAN